MQKLIISLLFAVPVTGIASEHIKAQTCVREAAYRFGVNPEVMHCICQQESSWNHKAYNYRSSIDRDIGLCQINNMHLPRLAKLGIQESHLWDSCINSQVGAWILADNLKRHGNTWRHIGAYNAASDHKRAAYAKGVYRCISQRKTKSASAPQALK